MPPTAQHRIMLITHLSATKMYNRMHLLPSHKPSSKFPYISRSCWHPELPTSLIDVGHLVNKQIRYIADKVIDDRVIFSEEQRGLFLCISTNLTNKNHTFTNTFTCQPNRFTEYLTTILPLLSYDNAKVTIDLWQTSNLQNILRRTRGFS